MKNLFLLALTTCSMLVSAQTKPDRELKMNLNDDGSHYLKATFTGQVWTRFNQSNPGSKVNGYDAPTTFDIGLRRVRAQFFGKISNNVFLYTQVGINNEAYNSVNGLGNNSGRKPGIFFHDVVAEYYVTPSALQIGAGLTAWTGFMRYSSPAVASIMAYDAPLYQQSTNDVNDQFLRKLSLYAKGKLGKLDYRLVLSKPLMMDTTISTVKKINSYSDFSYAIPMLQTSGYFMYQFFDEESNLTPYMSGTYLGKKNVFNVGAGFQYQPNAMWHYKDATTKDTIKQNMLNVGFDIFFDHPLAGNGSAITTYVAVSHTDYGKNYVRNNGAMNPATASSGTSFNGGGSAFPMYGTGSTVFGQVGYLLPKNFLGEKNGQLQPYADFMLAKYDRLKQNMLMWDVGANWLIDSHRAKISLNYQNRPIFNSVDLKEMSRKGMLVLQFQIAI